MPRIPSLNNALCLPLILGAGLLWGQAPAEATPTPEAVLHLMARRDALGLDADHAFRIRHAHSDHLGQSHSHVRQFYQGVRVWGGEAITHQDRRGLMQPITNALYDNIQLNVRPSMGENEALHIAQLDLNPKGAFALTPTVELVVYPEPGKDVHPALLQFLEEDPEAPPSRSRVGRYALAYHLHTELDNAQDGLRHTDFLVDAHTGAILKRWETLHTTATSSTGKSQYSGVVALDANATGSGFELRDLSRGKGGTFGNNVVTDLAHGSTSSTSSGQIYTSSGSTWGDGTNYIKGGPTTSANGQTAAVDAMYGLMKAWDFYKFVMGRNGIDGLGTATYARVHVGVGYDNAYWSDSCFCMTYGDGTQFTTLTALDVAGHEISHGVCAATADLNYEGESGGLNEANSDIFGTLVEFYARGGSGATIGNAGGNWTIGEQLRAKPLRYMYKPSLDGISPDAWSPNLGSLDVHYSSGPMNRCFYFLSQGATPTGQTSSSYLPNGMAGMGNDQAAAIWYRALTTYLTSRSDYAAARAAAIRAAKDLYGVGSPQEQVVWNAFAAIHVGSPWADASPAILTQPADQAVPIGKSAQFTVSAVGTGPLTYQWKRNGLAIPSAKAAFYATPATTVADNESTYSVTITNSLGYVTSASARLRVGYAPAITGQPTSALALLGRTATFKVSGTGTGPLSFQWKRDGLALAGANTPSYTTPPVTTTDTGASFLAEVSNDFGTCTSTPALLSVGWSPTISTEPADLAVLLGSPATFTVLATGSGALSYQWRKNGVAIPGATSATYTTPANRLLDSGSTYYVVIANTIGTISSRSATLSVGTAPLITTQPTGVLGLIGRTAAFSVTATGTGTLSYQWLRNSVALPGATSPTYITPTLTASDNGACYTVTVRNAYGTANSAMGQLILGYVPVITSQPANAWASVGRPALFGVTANGTGTVTYQWMKNGVAIPGATSATYTTPGTTLADHGSSFCVNVSNSLGTLPSKTAILNVGTAPTITAQPLNALVLAGRTATYSVSVSGSGPLSYQWQRNGMAISGATLPTYTTPALVATDGGCYFLVTISNGFGTVTSTMAQLGIGSAPSLTNQPMNAWLSMGRTLLLGATATGTGPLGYQWSKNGKSIPGATASTYLTPAATLADQGCTYAVTISNSLGTASGTVANMNIGSAPTIIQQPANALAPVGGKATYSVTCAGSGTMSYQWSRNGVAIPGATLPTYTTPVLKPTDAGCYFLVTITSGFGAVTSTMAQLRVGPA